MRNLLRSRVSVVWIFLALAAHSSSGISSTLVSPGERDRVSMMDDRCPTFSWVNDDQASSQELVVYELKADGALYLSSQDSVIRVRLPAGALSWTPASDRCLEAGLSYVWSIGATLGEHTDWSDVRLFEVSSFPSFEEVEQALGVLRRYLRDVDLGAVRPRAETVGATPLDPLAEPPSPGETGPSGRVSSALDLATAATGLRSEGQIVGVLGVSQSVDGVGVAASNQNGGADLLLDGSADSETDTLLSQSGLDRSSNANESFGFSNSGAGSMILTVDGASVVTTQTDSDDQSLFETIDTPTGTDPVADAATDTLQLIAGAGITITGNASNDTITFTAKGEGDADTLDTLDSTSFLRSDAADTATETLTLSPASGDALLTTAGRVGLGVSSPSSAASSTVLLQAASTSAPAPVAGRCTRTTEDPMTRLWGSDTSII